MTASGLWPSTHLTERLPHHPAYRSVPGGSGRCGHENPGTPSPSTGRSIAPDSTPIGCYGTSADCARRSSDSFSALRPIPAAISPSADFSVRLVTVALCALCASFATLRTSLRLSCALRAGQAQREISPGKNARLRCTTAGFTPLRLDHDSFAVSGALALLGSAFYPILVHRLAAYAPRFLPTIGHPHAVALHFVRCDQLTAGLTPAGVRPCWAHQKKTPPKQGLSAEKLVTDSSRLAQPAPSRKA